MIWTILSVLVCAALVIKLTFFTEEGRIHSRLFYRVMLFLASVYAFYQVVMFLYYPERYISPVVAIFHIVMFIGAFLIKPEHLPGNRTRSDSDYPLQRHIQDRRHDP